MLKSSVGAGGPDVVQLLLEEPAALLQGVELLEGQRVHGSHELEFPLQLDHPGGNTDSLGKLGAGRIQNRVGFEVELGADGLVQVLQPHTGLRPLDLQPGELVACSTQRRLGSRAVAT